VAGFEGLYGNHAWLGIPFASAPTGALRWRAPRPPVPWKGTRQALKPGASCPQFASPGGGAAGEEPGEPSGNEDCLFLNVFAPRFAPGEVPRGSGRLPVMLWIHGGGNSTGDSRPYDGGRLAARHDLVVVTVHYRLGVFGWFSHSALRAQARDELDRSGNWGTLDLVRSLQWVRENIAAFGGDPNNITLFGESSGATNVLSLLVSPVARGSFQQAIAQSGSLNTVTPAEAENLSDSSEPGHESSSQEVLLRLLIADGAVDRSAAKVRAAAMSDAEIASFLRTKPADDILRVFDGAGLAGMYSYPGLIRDGVVIPTGEPLEAFSRPDGSAPVPAILGTNRDENKLFLLFGSEYVARLFGLPLWLKDERAYDLAAEYSSKFWKARGVDEPAAALQNSQAAPVFAYRFDWDEEPSVLWADFSKLLGAAHALEIPFVFGTFDLGPGNRFLWDPEKLAGRDRLSDAIMSYWAQFAYTGDPGRGRSGTLEPWKPWDASSEKAAKFLLLDTAEGGGMRMSADTVDTQTLLAQIADDDRFASQRERCDLYYQLARWGDALSEEEYATVGNAACRDFPFDSHPWPQ
jgi:para-nitrobenzyl esterase